MYRILLADDEGIMLESLKKIIETEYGNECEIHCAKSGRVVVEMAQAYPPDICFMDIQMPVMNGRDAAKQIRSMDRKDAGEISIFALSADAFVEDQRLSAMSGMNGHFTKPIDFEEMRVQIGKILKGRRKY